MGKNFEIIFREFANSETFVMSRGLLEDYKAKAAQEERDRIIELLEQRLYPIYYPKSKLTGSGEGELIGEIIALIKGENK